MNDLDPDACYRALSARDPRYDGVFFVAVSTTGIYCRPVCRARLPGRDRCTFFGSAAAAEAGGFRPCLRCRPERAPGRSTTDATLRLAERAAARIAAGALNADSVDGLAAALHTSGRQLRRAVKREYGVTPVQLAQTHRLLLAKRLLTESDLPIARVAYASGFSSVRRFNALFLERYRLNPGGLRRRRDHPVAPAESFTLALDYRPPLEWSGLVEFLGARAIPGVEAVVEGRYCRTVVIDGQRGWVAIGPHPTARNALAVELSLSLAPVLMPLIPRLRSLLDLDAEPEAIDRHLAADPLLEPGVRRRPGTRLPGAVDGFEMALRAVLGQQVTVRGATTLAGRFARAFGAPAETPFAGIDRYPFDAAPIAETGVDAIASLGLPGARAACVVELARRCATGELALHPAADVETTMRELLAIPGIGPWTAEYVAMRGLHWPDAFPAADLGIRKALGGATTAAVARRAERWRPWRAYATLHLWRLLSEPAAQP